MSGNEFIPLKDGTEPSTHFALQVALQTMKERCQSLQKRLTTIEDENLMLRMNASSVRSDVDRKEANQTEVQVLREKVSELSRRETQLKDHISMVAAENRQLWSRLSKLTKDNQTLGHSLNKIKDTISNTSTSVANQNLIRSKTFTKSAPNPKLREKLNNNADYNLDLEETGSSCDDSDLAFLHFDDELLTDLDNDQNAKKCTDGLIEIQKELLKQQTSLKAAIGKLEIKKEVCASCRNKKQKPETADKNLATDNDLLQGVIEEVMNKCEEIELTPDPQTKKDDNDDYDLIRCKIQADALDKMCPMCGKIYVKNTTFYDFQEHVESHFIQDTDLDMSIDRSFECISQTVGNF